MAEIKEIDPRQVLINNHYTTMLPEVLIGNKSATLNGSGYVFFTISPLSEEFIKEEGKPGKSVLEIGAGYSNVAIEALKEGVERYTANDISEDHLKILAAKIYTNFGEEANNKIKHLKLLCGKAPDDLPKTYRKYDAILIDKVLHFMKPLEAVSLIKWAKPALKKNGKIYVLVASPYSKMYQKILPEYLKKRASGDLFPGHFTSMMDKIDYSTLQNFPHCKIPDEMVLYDREDLIHLFERSGMKILKSYSFEVMTKNQGTWRSIPDKESNFVGVIVSKI